MIAVNIQKACLGFSPQVLPIALLHCIREIVAFRILSRQWGFQLNLESRITPKHLTCLTILISLSPSLRGDVIVHLFFQVNKIPSVLAGLKQRPVFSPQSLILFRHCCPMSTMVSISIPLIKKLTSSAKPSESA